MFLRNIRSYSAIEESQVPQDAPTKPSTPNRVPTRDLFANPYTMQLRGSGTHLDDLVRQDSPIFPASTSAHRDFPSFSPITLGPAHPADLASNSPRLHPRSNASPITRGISGSTPPASKELRAARSLSPLKTEIDASDMKPMILLNTPSGQSSFEISDEEPDQRGPRSFNASPKQTEAADSRSIFGMISPAHSAPSPAANQNDEISIDMNRIAQSRPNQGPVRSRTGVTKSITLDAIASIKSGSAQDDEDQPKKGGITDLLAPRRKPWTEMHLKKRAQESEAPINTDERTILPFLLDLGVALQCFGAPAHRSEYRLYSVAKRFALNGHFIALPSALFCSISQCGSHPFYETSHVRRVPGIDFNMERLCVADHIADQVAQGKLDPEEGALKIEEALLLPLVYSEFVRVLSFGLSSAGILLFFGKGYYDMVASFITGIVVGIINHLAEKYSSVSRLNEVLGAFFAYVAGYLMNYIYPMSPFVLALAGVCWHLPGLSLTIAMEELATGNRVSGTARVTGAFITLFLLGLGMGGGNIVTNFLPVPKTFLLSDLKTSDYGGSLNDLIAAQPDPTIPLWVFIIATVVCSVSFGVLFNIRVRDQRIVILSGIVGFFGWLVGAVYMPTDIGNFLGAFCVAICANIYSRYEHIPTTVGTICGILLLVPGSVGQQGVDDFMKGKAIDGMNFVFQMLLISVQIVAGLFVGNAVVAPSRAV